MPTVQEVIKKLETIAPSHLVASWDNVGLLLGDRKANVQQILTCLTLTEEVADEAVAKKVQLIVTHHPILFRGAKRLTADSAEGRTVLKLANAGIAVYSPHTCFDDGPGGINDQIAIGLGLIDIRPLRTKPVEECKIVMFVPDNDLSKVSDAIFNAGAGVIGQYRECSFRLTGIGTFFGTDSTNPSIGQKGRREEVMEWRLEAVCPKSEIDGVVAAIRSSHSYEEPAFDIYPLMSIGGRNGAGRIGELNTPTSVRGVAERTKSLLKAAVVQVVGEFDRSVSRVAVACGAAGEFLDDARRAKADVFLTGEMRFHDYLAAQAAGIALILPGHYASERFALETLAQWLTEKLPDITATASESEKDPITFF